MLTDPLAPFQAGVPLEKQMTAGRMNGILAAIKSSRMGQGAGLLFTQDSGGTTVSARRPRNPPSAALLDPYAVITPSATSIGAGGTITFTIAAPANVVLYDYTLLTFPSSPGGAIGIPVVVTRVTGNLVLFNAFVQYIFVSIMLDGYRPYYCTLEWT